MVNRIEIIHAAERGDLERLLNLVSLGIADAWWQYTMRSDAARHEGEVEPEPDWETGPNKWETDPDGWASEIYYEGIFFEDEDTLREYLRTLATRAPEDADLGYFGASQLEDFIGAPNEDRLQWIEQEAGRSENFRQALATVWIEDLGPEVFLRVQTAARTDLVWHVTHGPRPLPDGSFADPSLHRHMT